MTQSNGYRVVSSEVQFTGKIISVLSEELQMPDGTVAVRDVISHPGAVGIVALDDHEQIVLVHQYRNPVRTFLYELPAGLLDNAGEPTLEAAQRELYEEAKLHAARWDVLVDLLSTPGMTNEAIRIYLARDLTAASEAFEAEHEEIDMTISRVPLSEAVDRVLAGDIRNAAACAGILAAEAARARNWDGLRPGDARWSDRDTATGAVIRPLDA